MIKHDENGPFVRASRGFDSEQSETVYAIRVEYASGKVEFWDTSSEPIRQERIDYVRRLASRIARDSNNSITALSRSSRKVTIIAEDWETEDGTE